MKKFSLAVLLGFSLIGVGCSQSDEVGKTTINVGYFPNITHAQALVGLANGEFQTALGEDVQINAKQFNAGPAEIEALLAGEIDIGYVGPSPAVNGYIKSQGQALRIISGVASGGAALVLQPELATAFATDGAKVLEGKKIASPQIGNTQDVALRNYLAENGLTDTTEVIPIANADQLTLFSQKELDGAWAPEPWVSRLVQEAGGVVAIDERDLWPAGEFASTVVIARKEFLDENPGLVEAWLSAHNTVTDWIITHPTEAQQLVNTEIEKLTTKKLADSVLAEAWQRFTPTTDPLADSITMMANRAYAQGVLGDTELDLTNLYDLTLLNEARGQ